MTLVDSLKTRLGLAGDEGAERHEYRCNVCRTTFRAEESDPSVVACENCGGTDVTPA